MRQKPLVLTFLLLFITASAQAASGHLSGKHYRVTITNITKNISFTPFIVASHTRNVRLFTLGEMSSDALAALAEGGATDPLRELLMDSGQAYPNEGYDGLLAPGQSVDIDIRGGGRFRELSLAAMLLPTNDTFVSLNGVALPRGYRNQAVYLARAYDAGSETNNEVCVDIPGPTCGGAGPSPDDAGEGYVYPSPGIHGGADLSVAEFNWSDPVARVVIQRVRQ